MQDIDFPRHIYDLLVQKRYLEAKNAALREGLKIDLIDQEVQSIASKALESFEKYEYEESIDYYISTIGFLDPSIVLWHFIEPHLSIHLTNYLIELHKRGFANKSHTGLLFLLFRNSDAKHKLVEFTALLRSAKEKSKATSQISGKKATNDTEVDPLISCFDSNAAIDALIENEMMKEALEISWILESPKHIVSLLITYKRDYIEAANQIYKHCNHYLGRPMLMEYGPFILEEDEKCIPKIVEIATLIWSSQYRGQDEDYLKLFSTKPHACYSFLKSIVNSDPTPLLANTLIAMVVPRDPEAKSEFFGLPGVANEQLARDYIRNDKLKYDPDHLIRVCSEARFHSGMILLLEKQGRLHDIVMLLVSEKKSIMLMEWCIKNPHIPSDDWVEIFHYFAKIDGWISLPQNSESIALMQFIIKNTLKTLPIAAVLEELSNNDMIPIEIIRDFFEQECKLIEKSQKEEESKHAYLKSELDTIDEKIEELEEKDISFSPKDCDMCKGKLERHLIGFMCKHMFHVGCAGKKGDMYYCPLCGCTETPYETVDEVENNLNMLINEDISESLDLSQNDLLDQITKLIKSGFLDQLH